MRSDLETVRHPQAIVPLKTAPTRRGHRFTLIFVQHGGGAAVLSSCESLCV